MSEASIKVAADGRLDLSGDLNFSSVPVLWGQLRENIVSAEKLVLSLAGVGRANSAGLAMLIEALELARQRGTELRFESVPEKLMSLARMSNVDQLLLD